RDGSFTMNGSPVGTATTGANGVATVTDVSLMGLSPGTYAAAVVATFVGDELYAPSSATADLIVEKLTPLLTWPTPASIVYGTALDATQLNATANVPGVFFYSPPAGAILPPSTMPMAPIPSPHWSRRGTGCFTERPIKAVRAATEPCIAWTRPER